MVPSSASIADQNTVLNTIVAETLSRVADRLEKAEDVDEEVWKYIKEVIKNHKRIIFNGNNYAAEWVAEAERRGLPNISSSVEAYKALVAEKNIKLLEKHQVLTSVEAHARYEIHLENYVKTINIEALTMLDMAKRQILPAVIEYSGAVASSISAVNAVSDVKLATQEKLLAQLTEGINKLGSAIEVLEGALENADHAGDSTLAHAEYYRDVVFAAMKDLRAVADELETIVSEEYWPIPTYADMLFNV